ncbi:MAG: cell division protein FtsZ [Dehalococcoidia bacterium]|nr:cell division protein FtsZ [Dehalococcoidia bacterium]
MKLVVIGLGQCGGRLADEFARLNLRARQMRGLDVLVDAFAVNSDTTDLTGITTIKADHHHRILIGAELTRGHGVAKMSDVGADIALKDGDKVIDTLRRNPRLFECDAFLLVTSTGGGTGSGAAPIIARLLKERVNDRPVYVIAVLPFEHEEENEEHAVFNTAVCLKSLSEVADAVFLVDNQRYVGKDASVARNIQRINQLIAAPFFNLLCAGEERKPKHIGAKTMDAGDIIQTLAGWTAIGYGQLLKPIIPLPHDESRNFYKRGTATEEGIRAMDEAIAELSVTVKAAEAYRALYLISGPHKDLSLNLIQDLDAYLRLVCPQATIRGGDYPVEKGVLDITVILSELGEAEVVRHFYQKATKLQREQESRQQARANKANLAEEAGKDIPTLL